MSRTGRWVLAAVLLSPPLALLAVGPLQMSVGPSGGLSTAGALAVSLILAPCLEEWVLRSGLQRGVVTGLLHRRWRPSHAHAAAAALATLAFALIHLPSWSLAGVWACVPWLLPGVALAAAWCWRCRTRDCIALHAFFNACLWLAAAWTH